ncbi:hypothetical protein SDJN03_09969, partial [Cucurbita argyrosperma subsp. sororia]
MLSIENPPPDPPLQQLKANVNDDERPSQHHLPLPEEDLSSAAVLDHSTFPNFSLRDYVFNTRSKDIRNNWPFSLKNLQLCLKHGVKDLLPPFQSTDCVRNHRLAGCGGESSTREFENVFRDFSEAKEHVELDTSAAKLNEKQVSPCEGENGLSSTMTSISQSQNELASTSGPSSLSLRTNSLLETLAEVETTGFRASEKNEIKIKTSGKMCKIIRKSTNHIDQTSAADIATSFSIVSESMASKVCPVCKTFSSSSNTTLNAHIDQCLSIASTPKCSSDSKLTRYRIKPRKTKLMVDIYATARPCTLEELDRRNGTAWATLSGFQAQDIENHQTTNTNEGKKQKVVSVHPEDIGDNGDAAVYIDANGTKLRILSKFSSPLSLPDVQDDVGSRKLRGVKERKFHSTKKNKSHASAQGRKVSAQKCISQVQEHNQLKGSSSLEVHKITKQVKPHDSGTLRQWACSKRTRASKSSRKEGYHQPSMFKWHVSHGAAVDTDRLVLERSQVQDQTSVSSPESSERTENTEYEVDISDKRGWSPVRRSLRSAFSGEMVDTDSLTQRKKISNRLSKRSGFIGINCSVKPRNTNGRIIQDYQPSPPGSNKLSRNYHANALKARKLNLARRKEILVSSRFNRLSTYEKPRDQFESYVDDGTIPWHSTFDHSHSSSDGSIESDRSTKEVVTEVASPKVSSELKNRSNIDSMSKAIALSSSDSESEYDGCHEEENMDSHVRTRAEFREEIKGVELGSEENSFREDVSVDSSSKLALKESFMCFCKSMDPQFHKTRVMLQSTQNCSCFFYGSDGTKDMFFGDEDCSAMIEHDVERELDSEIRRGSSCFEVDPISIPGPPGSFLPSPLRDTRSEEYRGNSSLSNSWVHSCQDQHDLIDGVSSSSPISATSTISNATAARSCLKHNNSSGVSSDVFHDKSGSVPPNAGAERGDVQPCRCQRADTDKAFQDINVAYQEPTGHQSSSLETMPAMDRKQTTFSLNVRPNSLDIMPESHSQHTMSGSMVFPVDKSPFKSHSVNGFHDPGLEFSRTKREPASPVTSNPVLRLMGKNLMVVNKEEEDVAIPVKQPQPHPQLNHVSTPVPSFAGGSSQHVQNQASCSFPHWSPRDPSKTQDAGNAFGRSLDVRLSNGFRNPANLNTLSPHVREPVAFFLKQQTDSRAYTSDYTDEALNRPGRKQNDAAMYNTSSTHEMPDHQQMNALSATNPTKEVYAMGDASYHEARFIANDPKGGMRTTLQLKAPDVNAFCYLPKDVSNLDKTATLHNSNFQSTPSRKDHTSPVKWDCNSESAYVCRRGVF